MTSPSWFEPPPKHEPGCLKGCLFLVAFIVIGFIVLLGSVYYWGTRSHSAVARGLFWLTKIQAIAEKPATIPSLNVSASAREEVLERWHRFEQAARAGEAANIELTADDLNILIAENPNLDGKLFATIEDNRLRLQVSVRLTQAIFRAAQYLNAEIVIEAPGPEAFDHPDLSRIRVNRAPLPSDFLEWKYSSRRMRDYLSQYAETSRVGSMQIRDGKLVLHSRSD
jgi:hypothetical protein